MKAEIRLNLASHPRRNRRLFWGLIIILVAANLIFWSLSIKTMVSYQMKMKSLNGVLGRLENKQKALQKEGDQFEKKIKAIQVELAPQVDRINRLIAQKAYSWESFFSDLERLIPARAYVVSLNPVLSQDWQQVSVRLKLAAPSLDELMEFTKKLAEQGCREIKVISEEAEGARNIVSEINFVYFYREVNEADN
ncbi:MAG: hypothetical protein B5M54_01130 [Candidatus Aminicenantes bacterium 4484_214]|nr:MAG: hypothetical protein B5M54_01130 [Candidatus Aminicenantes bacterium 4484_214]